MINLTISDEGMNLYKLNKKLKSIPQNVFIFDQINKLTMKIYCNLSNISIQYYRKHRIPIMPRHFLKKTSESPEYIQTHCNVRNNPFHLACRKWYL